MSKPKQFSELEAAVKKLLSEAKDFDQRGKAIETAMRFEALKMKAKGPGFGKGFDNEGDHDDDAAF